MKIPTLPLLGTLVAGSALLSCADIASPTRSDTYEWRFIAPTGPTTADTLSFHWPQARLPVKIWAEDNLNLPTHVEQGIEHWKAAFIHGEFDAVMVSDSNAADVVVRAENDGKGVFQIGRLESALAPQCGGATDIVPAIGVREIQFPVRVFVYPRFAPSDPGFDECMALTATHELGHVIGILTHSPVATDIMYGDPTVSELSSRDRSTAELVYHVEPNLTVGRR